MTTDTTNVTNKKAEQRRGFKEGAQQFELLRAKWPKAFPIKSHEIRPLTNGAQQALVEAFGWTPDYARGVLALWKTRPVYCKAILCYSTRINLDGSASAEDIGDTPRAMATQRLEKIAEQRAKKAEQQRLCVAAKASAEPKAQTPEPTPAPTLILDAEPEPAASPEPPKPRRLLVAGSAAMEAALKRRLANGPTTTEVLKTVLSPSSSRRREKQAR
jgi:sRNA-binding protein